MNTPRYGWPVIIAASLHGALFLIMPDTPARAVTTATTIKEIPLKPLLEEDRIEMKSEDSSDSDTVAGGPAQPLPSIPDVVEPLRGDEPFTVPVTPSVPVPYTVPDLTAYRGLPSGPGTGPETWGRPAIPDVHKLDRIPRAVVQTAPAYPDTLRREGINGSVTVEFVVGTDGRVVKADAVKWSHRAFVDPAVRAVLRWRFEPGTQSGRKVSFRMAVPIEFNAAL